MPLGISESSTPRGLRGYSLIEILAGISLLAVLMALLFPLITSMGKNVENAKSVSNLRQIGVLLHTYAGEHGGYIPPRIEQKTLPDGRTSSGLAWHSRLVVDGYVQDKSVFFNPKEKYKNWNQWVNDPSVPANLKRPTEAWHPVYGYRLNGWPDNSVTSMGNHLPSISHPSQFFIMVESWMVSVGYPGYFVSSDRSWRIKIDARGIANTLFADGHVEAKTRDYFMNLPQTPPDVTGGGTYYLWPETP